ncbi:MAG TPA: NAD(P)H-quinone oxidoreductase [Candidatus Binatia bacterium]|jgi:putative PIG3 family NAD(P)H quinone oxidoreductase|nr:NAD(P)H-quinone oxidoreductase [Candidatus Binatia bacterium]
MQAITVSTPGGPEVLRLTTVPDPTPTADQILVRVRATALNRADVMQRLGQYPPPPGESDILGLELAGEVEAVGAAVKDIAPGDRVFGLVGSGGYAEKAVIDARMAMPIPAGWSFTQAAAVPEVFFTAQETLFTLAGVREGETVLIHAAASGVGTAGIQMARETGARVLVTAGSAEKIQRCRELGATAGCNYKEQDFAEWVKEVTHGQGVDVIEDFIGAAYWERNLRSLKTGGRLVLVGLMGGVKVEANLGLLMTKRLQIFGSVLRSRPLVDKIAIAQRFRAKWLPLLAAGRIKPIVDRVFPLAQAAEAHRYMEENRNFGKIILAL